MFSAAGVELSQPAARNFYRQQPPPGSLPFNDQRRLLMFSIWGIAAIILDIFAINHVLNSSRDTFSKVVLIVLILLVPIIASGIYLLVFRDKGYAI
jgi:hypothetical protein